MAPKTKQKFTSIMLRPDASESKLLEQAVKLTGEAAATKAVFRVLAGYETLKKENERLENVNRILNGRLEDFESAANDLRSALQILTVNKRAGQVRRS